MEIMYLNPPCKPFVSHMETQAVHVLHKDVGCVRDAVDDGPLNIVNIPPQRVGKVSDNEDIDDNGF